MKALEGSESYIGTTTSAYDTDYRLSRAPFLSPGLYYIVADRDVTRGRKQQAEKSFRQQNEQLAHVHF